MEFISKEEQSKQFLGDLNAMYGDVEFNDSVQLETSGQDLNKRLKEIRLKQAGIYLSLAEFSEMPGPRLRSQGPNSAEEFFESRLMPRFAEALEADLPLRVNMDNVAGVAASFIAEAFGRLSACYGAETVLDHLVIEARQEPYLTGEVTEAVRSA